MVASPAAYELICRHEGLKLEAYRCPGGKWTIGYGSTTSVSPGLKITEAQAKLRLLQDIGVAERAVRRHVTVGLNQNEFDALVSFVFNVGEPRFATSTLLKRLNAEDRQAATREFLRWNKATVSDGTLQPLPGLTKRRLEESRLFASAI